MTLLLDTRRRFYNHHVDDSVRRVRIWSATEAWHRVPSWC
jgi:hypothetical protein